MSSKIREVDDYDAVPFGVVQGLQRSAAGNFYIFEHMSALADHIALHFVAVICFAKWLKNPDADAPGKWLYVVAIDFQSVKSGLINQINGKQEK